MIKKLSDVRDKIESVRANNIQRGDSTGFRCLDGLYSLKQGSYTCILAEPTHGKTELSLEILYNQAVRYGKRSSLNTPESGNVEDVFAELIHKRTGKSIYKTSPFACSDKEYYAAMNFIEEYFLIHDSDENALSFCEMYEDVEKYEKDNKGKIISILLGDPYNELKHDMSQYGARQDLYIEDVFGEMRRYVKKTNKHFILTLHPGSQQEINDTKTKSFYYPMPKARKAAGGQALLRKAFCWINMWRPPVNHKDKNGIPYKENQVLINIEKAKPKGVAMKGTTSLFYDWKTNRYYEEINEKPCYAFEHEKIKEPEPQHTLVDPKEPIPVNEEKVPYTIF